ncbi:pyrroline-5-carboxylate reductase [Altererythrobacter sp.]|uniref:pyrroline-5-carboxylate reductase family protein n=1 Tax=Altererythrobacter sp. TaxID=1872480 RepID=UPI001B18DE82|nr:pyrroline-5-carboxylate reductase [Altererythrobacter sp.]MBO6608851.1 pyrroline-5-carboxylate reductase [Altererythrobacter sp.]MBO6640891.1 pyrroline-5-carboxylate reductase [Altererythrobacter sp.]MBO6708411.1 pyrroline-5-carboxylate reductase [Altererythrobacter sp.]
MKILIYGYGKMTAAMVEGWLRAGMDAGDIAAYNPRPKDTAPGVSLTTEPPRAGFDAVVLGFKPHMLGDIAPNMQDIVGPGTMVLSVLAGITLDQLEAAFPYAKAHVRFMPNLAVALGKSPNVLAARELAEADRRAVTELASMLGSAEWLEDESLFDLATALAGSGPGFVYRFIDALADAACELGLPADMSVRLATSMVDGAGALAANSDFSPAELAERVASPGGMTREGLNVLDEGKALKLLLLETLRATADRGLELSRLAGKQA